MHPEKLDCLDAYLHVVTCDHCTEVFGHDAIEVYGQQLLAAVNLFGGLS